MLKVIRFSIIFLLGLGFLYIAIWGFIFKDIKLQISGHQIIQSEAPFFSKFLSFLPREYFISGSLSPDQNKIIVVSNISTYKYKNGKNKIILFEISTGKRLWEIEINQKGLPTFSKFVWSEDSSEILTYNLENLPKVIDASSGEIVRDLKGLSACVFVKRGKVIIKQFFLSFCSDKVETTLISSSDFSILWKKPFSVASKLASLDSRLNIESLELLSPNKKISLALNDKFIEVNSQGIKSKITSHWSVNSVIWSEDSSLLAFGGDDYYFNGIDGEVVYPIKNMLLLNFNDFKITKRRLLTYGEEPTVLGFIENSSKIVALTDTSIIIWKL